MMRGKRRKMILIALSAGMLMGCGKADPIEELCKTNYIGGTYADVFKYEEEDIQEVETLMLDNEIFAEIYELDLQGKTNEEMTKGYHYFMDLYAIYDENTETEEFKIGAMIANVFNSDMIDLEKLIDKLTEEAGDPIITERSNDTAYSWNSKDTKYSVEIHIPDDYDSTEEFAIGFMDNGFMDDLMKCYQ